MPVVTISRELGSLGDAIAEQIAQRLGYPLVGKQVIEQIFNRFGFVGFQEAYNEAGFWGHFDPHRAEMVNFLNRTFEALVQHGNVVLLGRGGFALFKGCADVLNVRIQAPFDLRAQRVLKELNCASLSQAEEIVRENDQVRRNFVNALYAERWDSVAAFDLVIDTGKISSEQAVDWLVAITQNLSRIPSDGAPATRFPNLDPELVSAVVEMLDGQAA